VTTLDVHDLAARLSKAVAERTAIDPLTDEFGDLDLETGYAVQRILRDQAGPTAGWKLG
jgi:2-oxo-3-hexenedioate decarboxylase